MKRAFTLVELLVVIGIIAILAGVLIVSMGGSSESARSARCLSNLKNLATACTSYAMKSEHYPLSSSVEIETLDESQGIKNARRAYYERPGWISWNSRNVYDTGTITSSQAAGISAADTYETDPELALYCLTNGTLWTAVGCNTEAYVCPSHVRAAADSGHKAPHWSYEMNGRFGGDSAHRGVPFSKKYAGVNFAKFTGADRTVLFIEMPFTKQTGTKMSPEIPDDTVYTDCAVQYRNLSNYSGTSEELYFNHIGGKKRYAHVAYADGHVDKLVQPSEGELAELVEWLCKGYDLTFDGKKYEKFNN